MPPRIPTDDLIAALQRLADDIGRTPAQTHLNEQGEYSLHSYRKRFGSWNEALEAAGLEVNDQKIPTDSLLVELKRVAEDLGKAPTISEMDVLGEYSSKVYKKRFDSWNNALGRARLDPNKEHGISEEKLLDELRRLGDVLGKPPRRHDMRDEGAYSRGPYEEAFGSWNGALEAAGFELNLYRNVSREDLLNELRRLDEELDHLPRREDMIESGEYGRVPYEREFGGWTAALEAAGFDPLDWAEWIPSGEDHPHWRGGGTGYGSGWNDAKRELVRDRDGRMCQNCGRTEEKHIELFDQKHTVHHIQKARSFDDPEKRNHPDNLITLCQSRDCHYRWEQMSPLRPQLAGDD